MQYDTNFFDFLKCTTFLKQPMKRFVSACWHGRVTDVVREGLWREFRKREERSDVLDFTRKVFGEFFGL